MKKIKRFTADEFRTRKAAEAYDFCAVEDGKVIINHQFYKSVVFELTARKRKSNVSDSAP